LARAGYRRLGDTLTFPGVLPSASAASGREHRHHPADSYSGTRTVPVDSISPSEVAGELRVPAAAAVALWSIQTTPRLRVLSARGGATRSHSGTVAHGLPLIGTFRVQTASAATLYDDRIGRCFPIPLPTFLSPRIICRHSAFPLSFSHVWRTCVGIAADRLSDPSTRRDSSSPPPTRRPERRHAAVVHTDRRRRPSLDVSRRPHHLARHRARRGPLLLGCRRARVTQPAAGLDVIREARWRAKYGPMCGAAPVIKPWIRMRS